MNEKIVVAIGFFGSVASILAFFGIDSSKIPNNPALYLPVGLAALVSLWVAARSQWTLFTSAKSDFDLDSPDRRLRNIAFAIFLLCIVVFAVLYFTIAPSLPTTST